MLTKLASSSSEAYFPGSSSMSSGEGRLCAVRPFLRPCFKAPGWTTLECTERRYTTRSVATQTQLGHVLPSRLASRRNPHAKHDRRAMLCHTGGTNLLIHRQGRATEQRQWLLRGHHPSRSGEFLTWRLLDPRVVQNRGVGAGLWANQGQQHPGSSSPRRLVWRRQGL
jgi:hypothetical protein